MKKLSKALALVLTLAIVLSMSSFNALAAISGDGSMDAPYTCETVADLNGIEVKVPAEGILYYQILSIMSEEVLNVTDSTGNVSIIHPRTGMVIGQNIGGVATCGLNMMQSVFGLQNRSEEAVTVTLSIAKPELGTEANPAAVEKNTSIGNAYIMNTTLEAGDSDGYWYSVTAEEDGIFYVEATSSTGDACCVSVEADGYYYTLDEGNPVITYRVEKGTEILVNVSMDYDSSWNFPAGKVYATGYFVEGTKDDPVALKSSPVRVPVVAGETVYVQDGSKAIFADTGLVISGYAIADTEVTVGTTTYTDKDGDGKIELMLGGDYYSRPVIAITNNASYNAAVTLTVVEEAAEGYIEPATGHELKYTPAVEADCHYTGNIAYWYCAECDVFYEDEVCTKVTNYLSTIVPATGGNVVHMEAVTPGCHMNGNIEYWYCTDCEQVWANETLTQLTNRMNVILPATGSGLVHFDKVEAGCHSNGNVEYWFCPDCEGFWTDEACTQLTNSKNVILPATGEGDIVYVEAVAPGCHYTGNIEYWYCANCEGFWTDEACTKVTNSKSVILPATGGEVVHVEAVTPSCFEEGNIEYWYCEECNQVWANEALTQITNRMSVKLPATCQNVKHVKAVDPTCHTNGNVEYWYCADCNTVWADENLMQITNFKNVIVSATSKVVHEEAVAPGCHYKGNLEHWYCMYCETVWTDADLTEVTNHLSVIIPEVGGEVKHKDAKTPSCYEEGNIEYWYCEECKQVWADETRTQLTNIKNVVLPATCQNVVHVEAVEATCHTDGNVEYWYCADCNTVWADENLMQITNFKNVIVSATSKVIYMEAVDAGCHYTGNVEHWYCEECDMVWIDADRTQVSNHLSVIIPELGGKVNHVEAITPGCYTAGNIEYWYCSECEQVWQDEARTQLTNRKNVVLPATCQNVVHVEEKTPSCFEDGNIEYWYCEDCMQVWQDEARTQLTNLKNVVLPAACQNVLHVEAIAPACHFDGNIEYWYCTDCKQVWQDEAHMQLTNLKNVVLPATGEGNVVYVEAVDTGCHEDGNIEYWYCTECEQVWQNKELTQLTNHKNVILPATGEGNIVHVEAVTPSCFKEGNIEHWYCEKCDKVWQNEELTQLTNHKNVILPAACQNVAHIEAVTPGCHFDGNIEYWYCADCDQVWADEARMQLTNHKNVVLPATGEGKVVYVEAVTPDCHNGGNIEHWYCEVCEQVWQDEALTQLTNHKNVILPSTNDGEVVHVEAVTPECFKEGNIEYWYCKDCNMVWADEALTQITNHMNVILPAACQNVVHIEAVTAGCHFNGNIEYWYCTDCDQVWADEARMQLTNIKNVILPATGEGNVVHMEAVDPGCHFEGNIEHWYCTECEQVWQDPALTQLTNHKNVIIPAVGGEVKHVDAITPSCTTGGNIEYWFCGECDQVWADEALTQLTNNKNVMLPVTCQNVVYVEAVAPGCHFEGNIEHWYCLDCDTVWADENRAQVTNHKNVILPATGEGKVVHVEAVAPGCHFEGNVEHWYCTECDKVWTDEALTQLTNHKNVVIAATGEGNLVHMEAVAPGCHFEGNIEHWYCTECDQVWADKALTQVTNHKNVIIPATGEGNLVHVDAKAPTAYADGNVEHWYCTECEVVWANEALTQITNHKNVIIPATGEKVESSTSDDKFYTNTFEVEEDSEEYKTAVDVLKDVIADKSFVVLEINLFTVEGNEQITVVDGYIYVTINVPAGIKVEEGQVLVVYRVNDDGSYTKCDTTVEGDEITFKTNHFSTYVVVAEDAEAAEPGVPDTGDNTNFVLWISVLALGVIAIASSVVMRKREF